MRPPLPGDFFVAHGLGWHGALIRAGTRSRYAHAGVSIGDGKTVEAAPGGAVIRHDRPELVWCHPPLTDEQRAGIVAAALADVDVPYSVLDIVSLGLLQFGVRPKPLRDRVARSPHLICSQLVDQAYLTAGVHLFDDGRLPMDVTPGDLTDLAFRAGWAG